MFSFGNSWLRVRSAADRLPEVLAGVLPARGDAQPWQEMLPTVGVTGQCGLRQVGVEEIDSRATLNGSEPELDGGCSGGQVGAAGDALRNDNAGG